MSIQLRLRPYMFIVALISCWSTYGQESSIPINYFSELQDEYSINDKLYMLEDPACAFDVGTFIFSSTAHQFVPYDKTSDLAINSCHWMHFKIKAVDGFNHYFKDWKLTIGEADYASVYIVDASGELIENKDFGKWYPASKKEDKINFKSQRVNISFDPSETLSFYIKYQKKDHQKYNVDVSFRKYDLHQSSFYLISAWKDWMFLGFLLTMILFNFQFFFSTKYIAYLFHGLFILGLSLYLLDLYGVTLNLPIIEEFPFLVQFVDMFGIAIADIAYFQFVRYYLNLNHRLPKWDEILKKIVYVKYIFWSAIIAYYYSTYNEPLTDKFILVFLLFEYSVIIFFLVFRLKPKDRAAFYLIIGSSFLAIIILIQTLSLFGSIGISKTLSQLAIMGEIITFSFGLSHQFNLLKDEEEKAEKIKELSEFKSKLLTNITHEFRTPLTIIQGVSELFQDSVNNTVQPHELKSGYDAIERNSRSLLNLVNQMLDLTKLESKTLQLDLGPIDLVFSLKDLIGCLSPAALKKNISLRFDSKIAALDVNLDEQKLHTVLTNLISNAIKFTPKHGQITVSLSMTDVNEEMIASIDVTDTGSGISEKDLAHIFDRFYQVKPATQNSLGTGIGLSLVKELIELMNGSIHVKSQLNTGTTFRIDLPVHNETNDHSKQIIEKKNNNIEAVDSTFNLEEEKPVLLIVEDNYDIIDYLERLLHNEYELVKAYDGLEGLEKAKQIIPDLVISDLMMPKLDGIKLCETLKADDKTNHIPIIILTAKTSFDHKIEGLKTGADAYLTKPFRKEELFVRLAKLNESRIILQKKFSQFSLIEKPTELKKENSFLHKVHAVIEDNLNNDQFNVEELAKLMHMSRMQLHRKFKAVSDRTSSNYIRSYRLHKSKPLLSDLNLNVSEVAWMVGFKDVNYYSKSFQKEFGMSPSKYRVGLKEA